MDKWCIMYREIFSYLLRLFGIAKNLHSLKNSTK